jgi:hypothetical protein
MIPKIIPIRGPRMMITFIMVMMAFETSLLRKSKTNPKSKKKLK